MRFRLSGLVFIALCIVITACAPIPKLRNDRLLNDSSFLTGEPCGPPCWRGITPGETAWNDALTIIEDDPTLDNLETRRSDDSALIGALWSPVDGDGCCQMYTENGDVVDILIVQTTPANTLSQVIEAYGEPTYLIGETLSDDQGVFSLFYPELSMLLYVFIAGEAGALAPTSEIIGFGYFAPAQMDRLVVSNNLHTWEGYVSYTTIMESDFEVTPSVTNTPVPADE